MSDLQVVRPGTRANLERILHRFWKNDNTYPMWVNERSLPKRCEWVIVELWRNMTPEDVDTKELRHQFNHLLVHGTWDFSEDK